MAELPIVLSMGSLVKLCNLGVPRQAPGRIDGARLGYWFEKYRIVGLPRDDNEHRFFEVAELESKWPTFVEGIRARLAKAASGPEILSAFDDDDEAA